MPFPCPLPDARGPRGPVPRRRALRAAGLLAVLSWGTAAAALTAPLAAPLPAPAVVPAPAPQAAPAPVPVRPEVVHWFSPPGNPGLRGAWLLGSEAGSGPYVLRVKLAKGGRILTHTHPDARHTTVLSGTLLVGFGAGASAGPMVAVPAGAVYLVPAGMPHALWARDGEVIYQESGSGPTGTRPLLP